MITRTPPDVDISNRGFQIWDYHPSHSRLLLRSLKRNSEKTSTNIDLIFVGVEYIGLPSKMRNLMIVTPNEHDFQKVLEATGLQLTPERSANNLFVFQVEERRYFVVAGGMTIFENKLGWFESTLNM